jgi:N-acetylmuramic acid 6-phosphate etherase
VGRRCEALGIETPTGLVAAVYRDGGDRARIAGLAPAVVAAAAADPSIVAEILEPAGVELADMVDAVARELRFGPGPLPLAMAGSFLLNCRAVSDVVVDRLAGLGYRVESSAVARPVEGALVLARQGWSP